MVTYAFYKTISSEMVLSCHRQYDRSEVDSFPLHSLRYSSTTVMTCMCDMCLCVFVFVCVCVCVCAFVRVYVCECV